MLTTQILPDCDEHDVRILQEIEDKTLQEDDCLVWQGQYHGSTPVRSYKGRRTSVRQLVYRFIKDPECDIRLTSSCGVLGCLNPNHLIPWDGKDNIFAARRRKLTPDQRFEILSAPMVERGDSRRLADRYGVSPSLVSKLRNKYRDSEEEDTE